MTSPLAIHVKQCNHVEQLRLNISHRKYDRPILVLILFKFSHLRDCSFDCARLKLGTMHGQYLLS